MKCPYCAEDIQDAAAKCKHCGEWLDESKAPATLPQPTVQGKPDYSKYNLYSYWVAPAGKLRKEQRYLFATDTNHARLTIEKELGHEYVLDERVGIIEEPEGQLSCPACGCRYTNCQRDIGCAVMIIIFISLGLGLIMIPFLPFTCSCT